MPYFIILGRWTEQGVRTARDSPKRVKAVKALFEKSGGKWLDIYYTFGDYDFIALVDQGKATDAAIMGTIIRTAGLGNIKTKTLKALSLSEATKMFDKLPKA
jgi:uncharacterized protein with GYD domain